MISSIAQSMYEWLAEVLFGEFTGNIWYTANRDTIIGIFIVVMCSIVVLFALWIVVSILRFIGRCVEFK